MEKSNVDADAARLWYSMLGALAVGDLDGGVWIAVNVDQTGRPRKQRKEKRKRFCPEFVTVIPTGEILFLSRFYTQKDGGKQCFHFLPSLIWIILGAPIYSALP